MIGGDGLGHRATTGIPGTDKENGFHGRIIRSHAIRLAYRSRIVLNADDLGGNQGGVHPRK